jgi:acyl-CoA synthetase
MTRLSTSMRQGSPVWRDLDEAIRGYADSQPDAWAFIEPSGRLSFASYDALTSLLAATLLDSGLAKGDRVALWMPDGAAVHVALSACLRAGVVATGIGSRAGRSEQLHLLRKSGARALLTVASLGGVDTWERFESLAAELPALSIYLDVHNTLPEPQGPITPDVSPAVLQSAEERIANRRTPSDQLSIINSTSGTTGLPKCVAHDERRWIRYHDYAVDSGDLRRGDVCMSLVPAPFGFGLWSSHFTPTLLGSPVIIAPRFDVRQTLELLERERVEVLMAVSTQFIMLLGSPEFDDFDLSALRVMFTGGEAIPYHKAEEFELRTGCTIVNMYGSNETGVQSYTTTRDPRDKRLTTCGRLIPELEVRLFDASKNEIARTSGPGRPGSIGEVRSQGYYNDPKANAELFTEDGWMLMGDLVTIDEAGYLTVVGRTSDFIIRGGKNISAPAVEQEVIGHPRVLRCAAVAMPDEIFGERICIYVVTKDREVLTLDDVVAHLSSRGVSKEWYPERLVLVDDLPVSSGGKLAKAELREDIRERMAKERIER